jgi:hypothetical protein
MADNPNWLRGAIGDLFDGKPSERKTGFFEDMLDGGGYANRGETGGILGFMQRMFGSETPGAPNGRPKMNVTMSVTDVPGRPKGRPNMTATPYYDGMGMGNQAGGQSTYYDGMGMDYGMGRLQAPQMQRPVSDSGMNPANAYQKAPEAMQYGGRGDAGGMAQHMSSMMTPEQIQTFSKLSPDAQASVYQLFLRSRGIK